MTRRRLLLVAILALGLTAGRSSHAQDTTTAGATDLEGWVSTKFKYDLNERWRLSVAEQLRLKTDISEVDRTFTELDVRRVIPHGFTLDGGVRFIRRNDTLGKIQGYESQRRLHLSTSYKLKPGRFTLNTRLRFQTKADTDADVSTEAERRLRFRVQTGYNLHNWKLDPEFSIEWFLATGGSGGAGFDKLRYTLGTEWDVWGGTELGLFFRIEDERNVEDPQTTAIIGLSLAYRLGRR